MRGGALGSLGGRRRRRLGRWLWPPALAGVVALGVVSLRAGAAPAVELAADLPGIGRATRVTAAVAEPRRGPARVTVELVQGERIEPLAERRYTPRPAWALWGPFDARDELAVTVGSETHAWLREGEAAVRVTAWPAATWLRRPPPVVEELALPVLLRPPALAVLSTQHYPTQAGVEVVVYRVGDTARRDGVAAGEWFFPGHPLPGGGAGDRFALFAVPYDLADPLAVRLVAEDVVGNRAERSVIDRLLPFRLRTATIAVDDEFMTRVTEEIEGQTPELARDGSLLERYLRINGELRRANAARLAELARESRPAFLWRQAFLPMPNAQVMAGFGERRAYEHGGREVDRQDHLGIDLASVERAAVPAANDGVVVLAEYFGIYGNTVVVDHGYGLATLYAHLSAIDVAVGDEVARGQTLGRSGRTGLAGGDHLHYAVLLAGLPVRPEEWWDGKWIADRLDRKLGQALPFVAEAG